MVPESARRLRDIEKARHYLEAREVVLDLGRAALEENGSWVLLHRDRPLEVPDVR